MREREVVVGRQQLEGMINSPDTLVQITGGPRDGGTEREREREWRSVSRERSDGGGDVALLEMTMLDV